MFAAAAAAALSNCLLQQQWQEHTQAVKYGTKPGLSTASYQMV
jgi:hypothetical protein